MNFATILQKAETLVGLAKSIAPDPTAVDSVASDLRDAVTQTEDATHAAIDEATKAATGGATVAAEPASFLSSVESEAEVSVEAFVTKAITPFFGTAAAGLAKLFVQGGEAAIKDAVHT